MSAPLEEERPRRPLWPVFLIALAALLSSAFLAELFLGIGRAGCRLAYGPELGAELAEAPVIKLGMAVLGTALNLAVFGLVADGEERRLATLFARRPGLAPDVMLAVVGILAVSTALEALVVGLGWQDVGQLREMREQIGAMRGEERVVFAAIAAFAAGPAEEVFFRGWALGAVSAARGPAVGLVVSSLLFALFHGDPLHSALTLGMGLFLGAVTMVTRSLWPALLGHAANNLVAVLIPYTVSSPWVGWLVLPPSLGLGLLCLYLLHRRHRGAARLGPC